MAANVYLMPKLSREVKGKTEKGKLSGETKRGGQIREPELVNLSKPDKRGRGPREIWKIAQSQVFKKKAKKQAKQ